MTSSATTTTTTTAAAAAAATISTPPTPYQTITTTLSFPSRDHEFWWHTYAPLLATLLRSADYDVHDQYHHLLFFQRHVVPALGPCPVPVVTAAGGGGGGGNEGFFRPSTITGGQPVELSVNYQQGEGEGDGDGNATVRYTFEPGSHMSRPPTIGKGFGLSLGSGEEARGPFNNIVVRETLDGFARAGIAFDQAAYDHFTHALAVDGTARGEREAVLRHKGQLAVSQQAIAVDLKKDYQKDQQNETGNQSGVGNGIFPKLYSFPQARAAISGVSVGNLIFDAFRNWSPNHDDRDGGGVVNNFPGLTMLDEYFNSPPPAQSSSSSTTTTTTSATDTNPTVLFSSCDLDTPSSSSSSPVRAKIYVTDLSVSFSRIESLWTLDGRLTSQHSQPHTDPPSAAIITTGLTLLRDLWHHLGLEEYTAAFPPADRRRSKRPLLMNYEVASTTTTSEEEEEEEESSPPPVPKVYLPLVGVNDAQIARGVVAFMRQIGWVERAREYEDMMRRMYAGYDLDETDEAQAWISFAYSARMGPYLTVYLYALDVV